MPLVPVSCGNSFPFGRGKNDPALLIGIRNPEQKCFLCLLLCQSGVHASSIIFFFISMKFAFSLKLGFSHEKVLSTLAVVNDILGAV